MNHVIRPLTPATAWCVDCPSSDGEGWLTLAVDGQMSGDAANRLWFPAEALAIAVAARMRLDGWNGATVCNNARY